MEQISLEKQIASLFHEDRNGIYTCAAGYSHARYEQYTEISRHLHKQILQVLDLSEVEYFLFAGSMVGYVRNGKMPYWMDDLDIIILEDYVQKFEQHALPILQEMGFNCFFQKRFEGGGYHVLAMQQGNNRNLSIPLTEEVNVRVPWAQVDMFYSVVDESGFIRNPAKWGLYHGKQIPIDWVRPGREVKVDDLKVRAFSRLEDDIQKEYGDVANNIVIYSHSETFLKCMNTPWAEFEAKYLEYRESTSQKLPQGVTDRDMAAYSSTSEATYQSRTGESFSSLCRGVLRKSAEKIELSDGDQIFWVMDLKRLFPSLQVQVTVLTVLHAQRAAHLRDFIDAVRCETAEAQQEYEKCMKALLSVLG